MSIARSVICRLGCEFSHRNRDDGIRHRMDKSEHRRTPWYAQGLSFECTGCGDCCSGAPGAVWLNRDEQERLATYLELELNVFNYRYTRRLGMRRALHERSSGDCCFYDPEERRCLVYDARPVQCRTYPFWDRHVASLASWTKLAAACEGARQEPAPLVSVADVLARTRDHREARAKDRSA